MYRLYENTCMEVLGPLLFLVFINDLPNTVQSGIKIFADDTKLYNKANLPGTVLALQDDVNRALKWSAEWQLPFNIDKCAVLHIGSNNPLHDYTMGGLVLKKTSAERDLGVIIDGELKFRQQAATAISKANRVLAVIRKSFAHIDKFTLPLLYKTLVRPLLEYGNASWGPFNRADEKSLERIQRRATRLVGSIRGLLYTDRMRALKLPSLYYRRRRGDMIRVYQLLHGAIDQDPNKFLHLDVSSRTRGHRWKLLKPTAVTRTRRAAFSIRIINDWNSLPSQVVEAHSLNQFKARLDSHWAHLMYDIPD